MRLSCGVCFDQECRMFVAIKFSQTVDPGVLAAFDASHEIGEKFYLVTI